MDLFEQFDLFIVAVFLSGNVPLQEKHHNLLAALVYIGYSSSERIYFILCAAAWRISSSHGFSTTYILLLCKEKFLVLILNPV